MTETTPKKQERPKVRVKHEPDTELQVLLTQLDRAVQAADDAAEIVDELKSRVKSRLMENVDLSQPPDSIVIPADPHGGYSGWTLSYSPGSWRIDTEKMKSEDPETYVKFVKRSKPSWSFGKTRTNQRPGKARIQR